MQVEPVSNVEKCHLSQFTLRKPLKPSSQCECNTDLKIRLDRACYCFLELICEARLNCASVMTVGPKRGKIQSTGWQWRTEEPNAAPSAVQNVRKVKRVGQLKWQWRKWRWREYLEKAISSSISLVSWYNTFCLSSAFHRFSPDILLEK